MKKDSLALVLGVVAVVIAIVIGYLVLHQNNSFGSVSTNCSGSTTCVTDFFATGEALLGQLSIGYTGTLASGTVTRTGTTLNRVDAGTCFIKAYAATIAASTTAQVDCQKTAAVDASGISPLTGVTYGDAIQASLSTSTANTAVGGTTGGIRLTGVAASSTSGYIVLLLRNDTGTTFTWPTTGSATGTAYYLATN